MNDSPHDRTPHQTHDRTPDQTNDSPDSLPVEQAPAPAAGASANEETWLHRRADGHVAEEQLAPDRSSDFLPPPHAPSEGAPPISSAAFDYATPLRGIDLVYLLGFYFLAGAALTIFVGAGAVIFLHISRVALEQPTGDRATIMIVSQGLLSVATLLFLYLLVKSRDAADFWGALGWHPFRLVSPGLAAQLTTILRYVLGGFALALTVGWLSRFFNQQTNLPMEDLFRSRQNVLLLMGLGILVAPVVEETIFRGCIYPVLARRMGVASSIILTGVLFGLAHAQQLWGGWGEISLLVCVGIVLTFVRAKAGTVAASYLVHVSYNTILFTGFYFATHGLRYFPS
jgi:membrane protease YdiL (CAAX protease family)